MTIDVHDAETRPRLIQTLTYFAVFVALGLGGVTLGPTLQGLAAHTGSTLSQISIVFSARSFGYMVGSFLAGRLYDRRPGHPVIAAVLVIMSITLVLAPLMPLLPLLVAVLLIMGVAEGSIDVGGNTMLVWLHGSKVGPYMNGLHFAWGVGAFLSPIIIAQAVVASGDITLAYWLLAALVLPTAVAVLRQPSPHMSTHAAGRPAGRLNVRLLALVLAFFFAYVAAEVTMGGWIFSYAVAMGQTDQTTAAYLTSVFWGSLTLGRLLSMPIASRFSPAAVLQGDLIGCLASVALILLLPGSAAAIWIGTFGTGLFMASMFPTMISYAERRMALSGQITGLFFVASAAGSTTVPWLVGQMFDVIGPGITIAMAFGAMLAAALAYIGVRMTAATPPVTAAQGE